MHLNIHPEHYNNDVKKTLTNAFEDKLGKQYTYEISNDTETINIIRHKLPTLVFAYDFVIEENKLPITIELNKLGEVSKTYKSEEGEAAISTRIDNSWKLKG